MTKPVSLSGASPDPSNKPAASLSTPEEPKKAIGDLAKEGENLADAIAAAGDKPNGTVKERLKEKIDAYEKKWADMYKAMENAKGSDEIMRLIHMMMIALKHGRGHLFELQGWKDMGAAATNTARKGAIAGIETVEEVVDTAKDLGTIAGSAASWFGDKAATGAAGIAASIKTVAQEVRERCSSNKENEIDSTPPAPTASNLSVP